jgi:hypothetical protein
MVCEQPHRYDILFGMHYNLNQRLKMKRKPPYAKFLLLCAVTLVVIAVYVLFIK